MRQMDTAQEKRARQSYQRKLRAWYKEHARDLPWRQTSDPYRILVSELMLQQTQVDRVKEKYAQWMKRFPTIGHVARAQQKTIVRYWQGLGYNRRALYLHRIAKIITSEYGGRFPDTKDELLALPGIGPYTAGAILSFAFHKNEPIVDTNVKRVLGRHFIGYKELPELSEEEYWDLSTAVTPKRGDTYSFNQALMDFGSLTCTLRKPNCGECPFQNTCASYPEIQNAKPSELRYQKKANERLYHGKPQRIWRGAMLQHLHEAGGSELLVNIGPAIQDDFEIKRLAWLYRVASALQDDGFVRITGTGEDARVTII